MVPCSIQNFPEQERLWIHNFPSLPTIAWGGGRTAPIRIKFLFQNNFEKSYPIFLRKKFDQFWFEEISYNNTGYSEDKHK